MERSLPAIALLVLTLSAPAGRVEAQTFPRASGCLPVVFEANRGQAGEEVKFISRGSRSTVFLMGEEMVLVLRSGASRRAEVRMRFVGADPPAAVQGLEPLGFKSNYFIGQDPSRWRTGIPNYSKVRHEGIYPGIDLVVHGAQGRLEYDLVLEPGADPRSIRIAFEGMEGLRIDSGGALILDLDCGGEVRHLPPRVFQGAGTGERELPGRYVLLGPREVGFEVDGYDGGDRLVIDPVLVYSTYLGGTDDDLGYDIAVDSSGSAYIFGYAGLEGFPATSGSFQSQSGGNLDVFVAKLDPSGTRLVYATFLGGSSREGYGLGAFSNKGKGIAVDASGSAYVTGDTTSTDFPVTPDAFQHDKPSRFANSAFVTKISPDGSSLRYSTYFGGTESDTGTDIAVDRRGNAYVVGSTRSRDFPVRNGYLMTLPRNDGGFLAKMGPNGSLIAGTFLGTNADGYEYVTAVALDLTSHVYVTGITEASNFPTKDALQPNPGGSLDSFVAKLTPDLGGLVYSTYLGGSKEDITRDLAVDPAGSAYVTGGTSSGDFPVTQDAFQKNPRGGFDVFVSKLSPDGQSLMYSTFIGSAGNEDAFGIAVDSTGRACVVGTVGPPGFSTNRFPITPDAFQADLRNADAFLTCLSPSGASLAYSTYLGGTGIEWDWGRGIALDPLGNAYLTGFTSSEDFPTEVPIQGSLGGDFGQDDAFVSKFAFLAVRPDAGGDISVISVIIFCSCPEGSMARLSREGQEDIAGLSPEVSRDGNSLGTSFDLTGKARGAWDVVVTTPDGRVQRLPGGFTIEEGRAPDVWVDVVGRDRIRAGRPASFTISYGNKGNVDAAAAFLWIAGIPRGASVVPGFEIKPPPPLPGATPIDGDRVPVAIEVGGEQVVPLYLPVVPPGVRSLKVSLSVSDLIQDFQLRAWVGSPLSGPPGSPESIEGFQAMTMEALDALGSSYPAVCVDDLFKADGLLITSGFFEGAAGVTSNGTTRSVARMLVITLSHIIECAGAGIPLEAVLEAVKVPLGGP